MKKNDIIEWVILYIILFIMLSPLIIIMYKGFPISEPKLCENKVGVVREVYYSNPTLLDSGYFILDVEGKRVTIDSYDKMYQVGDIYYETRICK